MTDTHLTVALISAVFLDAHENAAAHEALNACLAEARDAGAELAVLPELPLNRWAPATRQAVDKDAEGEHGPRSELQAKAASRAGIGLVGGAIVRDADGHRHNTALVFDASGELRATWCKAHVPQEPGFWEKDHYDPGGQPPRPIEGFALPFGVQTCSDVNRPVGSHLLAALGAEAVFNPRATEAATWERWRVVLTANALTTATYVLSVNRPAPEAGVILGGPSFAVGPDGAVLFETTETLAVVTLSHAEVARARRRYPAYLDMRPDLYARGWSEAQASGKHADVAKGAWDG